MKKSIVVLRKNGDGYIGGIVPSIKMAKKLIHHSLNGDGQIYSFHGRPQGFRDISIQAPSYLAILPIVETDYAMKVKIDGTLQK